MFLTPEQSIDERVHTAMMQVVGNMRLDFGSKFASRQAIEELYRKRYQINDPSEILQSLTRLIAFNEITLSPEGYSFLKNREVVFISEDGPYLVATN